MTRQSVHAGQVLTRRHLNRALLDRQLLLERSSLSVRDAVEQVGGLQTQYSPSGYIGLWTRLSDFKRDAHGRARGPDRGPGHAPAVDDPHGFGA